MPMIKYGVQVAALVCVLLAVAPAQADDGDEWQYRLTPYLWLPTIGGDVRYEVPPGSGTGAPTVNVGPADWLELLNYGLLIGGSAQKGKLSLFADFVYLSMSSEKDDRVVSVEDTITIPGTRIPIAVGAELNADTQTDLDGMLLSMTGGYVFRQTADATAIVFAGARYFDVDISTRWDLTAAISLPGGGVVLPSSGSIGGDTTLWDAIVGVRGEFGVGQGAWSMPYYFDFGGGDSDKTWNAFVGVAREFGWGDLLLAYRHLEYDQDDDKLLQDFSFGGPLVGVRFSF
jgi:hypothetical protein